MTTEYNFLLSAKSDMEDPKMRALMLAPGSWRVVLLKNEDRPEFTAFLYTKQANPEDERFTTEMYAMHHAHDHPERLISYRFGGGRGATAEAAWSRFKPEIYCPVVIKGNYPLPVMFYIGDADDRSNCGGLTVRLVKEA